MISPNLIYQKKDLIIYANKKFIKYTNDMINLTERKNTSMVLLNYLLYNRTYYYMLIIKLEYIKICTTYVKICKIFKFYDFFKFFMALLNN